MSRLRADKLVNRAATGAPQLTYGASIPVGYGLTGAGGINITGVATAGSFSGNLTGDVTGNVTAAVGPVLIGSATSTGTASQRLQVTGGVHISGSVGIGTTNPVGSLQVGAGTSTFIVTGIGSVGIGTTNPPNTLTVVGTTDIQGAVETVSVASTYNLSGGKYLLECNAQSGTVFTHTVPTAGNIGIVSFKNFPATKNSVTTFTIFITQNSAGTGNTTAVTGIGTNIHLLPTGATAGLTTSARVSTASTITLPTTGLDIDIVTFAVHYDGAGAATTTNYAVYASDISSFRFGSIRP